MEQSSAAKFSDSDIKEDIARRVTFWREQAQLSKSALATKAGKTRGEVTRWESGEVSPSIANTYRLASACGVSLAIFLTAEIPEKAR